MVAIEVLISSVVLGLSASFAPCLFPVLPSFIAYLTNQDANKKKGILVALTVTLGILTVFISIGFIINQFSESVLLPLYENYTDIRLIQGILLVILGLALTLRLKLQSSKLDGAINKIQNVIQKQDNPYVMAYLIGLFFTLLAAPCSFVTFGTFFTLVISNPGIANVAVLNILFSIGAGIPFFVMGALIPDLKDAFIENQDKIFKFLPIISGILIILTGMFLVYDSQNPVAF